MGQKKSSSTRKRKISTVGRPSREKLGLEPTVQKTLWVEKSIVEKLEEEHGTLSNALRFLAAQ